MGQQQLLLIVLGVIIVGIAVVIGISLFNANAETATQDSIVSQGTNIGAMAQQYLKKPTSMGGGQGSFNDGPAGTDFSNYFGNLPSDLVNSTDASWTMNIVDDTTVTLSADAKDYDWTVETTVTPGKIESKVIPAGGGN